MVSLKASSCHCTSAGEVLVRSSLQANANKNLCQTQSPDRAGLQEGYIQEFGIIVSLARSFWVQLLSTKSDGLSFWIGNSRLIVSFSS